MSHAMKQNIRQFRAATAHLTQRFLAKTQDETAEIYIYDVIGSGFFGGVSAKEVVDALTAAKGAKSLSIYINSPGGDVFEGIAMYNAIKRFAGPKTVFVDGLAASIASIIALAGDKVVTAKNAMWMIHDPWTFAVGNSNELRKAAEDIDKCAGVMLDTYAAKTKGDRAQIEVWMHEEVWMDAVTAKERGFTDEVLNEEDSPEDGGEKGTNASATDPILGKYKNTPEGIRNSVDSRALISNMEKRLRRASPATSAGQPGSKK